MKTNRPLRWYHIRWQTALIIIIGYFAARYFLFGRYKHAVGSGPAGPAVATEAFQTAWSTNEFVLVGIGDSVTAGFGASKKHGYFDLLLQNDDTTYPDMRGRDLRHVLSNLTSQNFSVSYTVSDEHLDQVSEVKSRPASVRGIVVI